MNKELKYEYYNITDLVNELDIMSNKYRILSTFKNNNTKSIYVIQDKSTNEKFFLTAKLKDFYRDEVDIYINLKTNNNITNIQKIIISDKILVIITKYIDQYITLNDTEYFDYFKKDLETIFFDIIHVIEYVRTLGYPCNIMPDDIMLSMDNEGKFNATIIDIDFKYDENIIPLSFCFYIFQDEIKQGSEINHLLEHYDGKYNKMVKYIKEIVISHLDVGQRPTSKPDRSSVLRSKKLIFE